MDSQHWYKNTQRCQSFMSLLDTLELRQELHLRKRQQLSKLPWLSICLYASISTVELSPLFAWAQCGGWQFSLHADIGRYASEVSPPLPRQLLFPIASTSAVAPRLRLHQLLLPNCDHFSWYTFTGLDYWTGPLDWDYWAGPLDWTTGLTQTFFNAGEKLIMPIQPTSLLNLLP